MAYVNPRRLKRNKALECLEQAEIHGKACLRWIELGDEEKVREQARLAATSFFRADRLKKVSI